MYNLLLFLVKAKLIKMTCSGLVAVCQVSSVNTALENS